MTSRIRSQHSRSPRGPNDIQYQLAQFHCGTHNPMERERVCRETQPEDIHFGDHRIAYKERVIPENWQSAHQRTNTARQAHPVRECLLTKDPQRCGRTTDLTTAQMFIQGNRLPRTPPGNSSPRMPESTIFDHSIEDRESHEIIQDFRDVRTVIHDWSPRKLWLLHQGLNYYQSRQYCLMPCHLCVAEEDGITYRCRQCVRPRLPEQREACLRLHHQCLCDKKLHWWHLNPHWWHLHPTCCTPTHVTLPFCCLTAVKAWLGGLL